MGFIDYAELKTRVSIQDAIQKLGLELRPNGHQLRGFCPKCLQGGDRALVVTPDKAMFYCFAAKTGGDQIALVAHLKDLKTNEAANWLAGTIPLSRAKTGSSDTSPSPTGKKAFDPPAYAARLDPKHEALAPLNLSPGTLKDFSAGYASTGLHRGKLAVALCDPQGAILGFAGVALNNQQLALPDGIDPHLIFNVHRAQGEVRLVRTILEVLQAHEVDERAICFLTDLIEAEQFEVLAAVQDHRKFKVCF